MEIKVGWKYAIEVISDNYTFTVTNYDEVEGRVFGIDGCGIEDIWSVSTFQKYATPLYLEVKATRLARKMFPNAEEENGMLILEE